MSPYRIPIYRPDLGGNEKAYVMRCLDSTWISSKGEFIERFERGFADRVGVAHAASVSNGTVALHLALLVLGIGAGDEVIVPTLTYVASANAVVYTGATPVFADAHPVTWQIDPADVERRITARTRAIMAVHLYGLACDMDRLREIAARHGLFLIEDCAEAIGTLYKGRHAGSFGDIATFSFFGNKTITTGEGGMVLTGDATLIERARHLKGQGLAANREYWHDAVGYNYRMTNICAAIGVAQLERLDGFLARKRRIAALYAEGLRSAAVTLHAGAEDTPHSYWMVSILAADRSERDRLRACLADAGIETRPVFHPLHTMPIHAHRAQPMPVAEAIAARGINLPSWPGLADEDVRGICAVIRRGLAGRTEAPRAA